MNCKNTISKFCLVFKKDGLLFFNENNICIYETIGDNFMLDLLNYTNNYKIGLYNNKLILKIKSTPLIEALYKVKDFSKR